MMDTRLGPGLERAGAREDACPRGSRGWAIAQRPARPGGRLGRSRDDGPEGRGQALPPANELVDPEVYFLGQLLVVGVELLQDGEAAGMDIALHQSEYDWCLCD